SISYTDVPPSSTRSRSRSSTNTASKRYRCCGRAAFGEYDWTQADAVAVCHTVTIHEPQLRTAHPASLASIEEQKLVRHQQHLREILESRPRPASFSGIEEPDRCGQLVCRCRARQDAAIEDLDLLFQAKRPFRVEDLIPESAGLLDHEGRVH